MPVSLARVPVGTEGGTVSDHNQGIVDEFRANHGQVVKGFQRIDGGVEDCGAMVLSGPKTEG